MCWGPSCGSPPFFPLSIVSSWQHQVSLKNREGTQVALEGLSLCGLWSFCSAGRPLVTPPHPELLLRPRLWDRMGLSDRPWGLAREPPEETWQNSEQKNKEQAMQRTEKMAMLRETGQVPLRGRTEHSSAWDFCLYFAVSHFCYYLVISSKWATWARYRHFHVACKLLDGGEWSVTQLIPASSKPWAALWASILTS